MRGMRMHFRMGLLGPLLLSVSCGCDAISRGVSLLGQQAKYHHCGRFYVAVVSP